MICILHPRIFLSAVRYQWKVLMVGEGEKQAHSFLFVRLVRRLSMPEAIRTPQTNIPAEKLN